MILRSLLVAAAFGAFASAASVASAQDSPSPGSSRVWKVEKAGPVTLLTIRADQPIDGWAGGFVPTLGIRCAERAPSVFVVTGLRAKPETGKRGQFSILYRLDDGDRVDEVWAKAKTSDTLVAAKSLALAQNLLKAKRLRFGFTPDSSSRMILEFSLVGLNTAMAPVSNVCGGL